MAKETHKCGPCGEEFSSVEKYLEHECSESGTTPTEIEHLEATTTPNARAVSDAALDRGDAAKATKGRKKK